MRKSQVMKALATGAVALGAVATAASPASAVLSAGASSCGIWYEQSCVGYAQDVPGVGASGADVTVACNASQTFSVQLTGVQCYIEGNNGDVHYSPTRWTQGQQSTLNYTFPAWSLSSRAYRVCVGAGYVDDWGNIITPDGFTCGAANL